MSKNKLVLTLAIVLFASCTTIVYAKDKIITATWYQEGKKTANGEKFDPEGLTAASRFLPFGTILKLTNILTNDTAIVKINDRGPFVKGKFLDVSRGAARALGFLLNGTAKLKLEIVKD
jgi:rare lipoprotein A